MSVQQTLRDSVYAEGVEPFGGNRVGVTLIPACEDTGTLFLLPKGRVKASLENAHATRSTIYLQEGRSRVMHVEHALATFRAYGIDNLLVSIQRIPSFSYKTLDALGLASQDQVLPTFTGRERELCDAIESVGVEAQDRERRETRVEREIDAGKLRFLPDTGKFTVSAFTDYPGIGKQEAEFEITPENFRDELSMCRSTSHHVPSWFPVRLAGFIAQFIHPSYGLSHGFTYDNTRFATRNKKKWMADEKKPAETARHAIVDRLGALALTTITEGRVEVRRSNHISDLDILKKYFSDYSR